MGAEGSTRAAPRGATRGRPLPSPGAPWHNPAPFVPRFQGGPLMNYRNLGRTGLKVSEISLGSWTTYGGSVDESDAVAIIRRGFELGINLFDTADVYVRGAAETVLGKAIRGLPREQLVIA